jgi:hypothetical protein
MYGEQPSIAQTIAYSDIQKPIVSLTYGESSEIYSINRGWKKAAEGRIGFSMHVPSGRFIGEKNKDSEIEDESDLEVDQAGTIERVNPFVKEISNILFLKPILETLPKHFLINLMYALAKGIQAFYQIEEKELGLDLLGTTPEERILFWEESEGSLGILNQIVESDVSLSQIAKKSLEILHFDPVTLDDRKSDCVCACYDCLMSYYNQIHHPVLDRHLIKHYLHKLTYSVTQQVEIKKDYNSMYNKLREIISNNGYPISAVIFLDALYWDSRRLPTRIQFPLSGKSANFYFASNTIVVCKEGLKEEDVLDWESTADNYGYVILFIPDAEDEKVITEFVIENSKFFPIEDAT